MDAAVTEEWHGTAGGYHNHGCRCPLCRAAQREEAERRKLRDREAMAEHRRRRGRELVEDAAYIDEASVYFPGEGFRKVSLPPMGELRRDDDRG